MKSEEDKKREQLEKKSEVTNKLGSIFVSFWFMLLHIILLILEKCGVESEIFILYKVSTPLFVIGIFILIIGVFGKKHTKNIELQVVKNQYNEEIKKYMIVFSPVEEIPEDCTIKYNYETYSNMFHIGCKYSIDECKYEAELKYKIINENSIEFDLNNYKDEDFTYIGE